MKKMFYVIGLLSLFTCISEVHAATCATGTVGVAPIAQISGAAPTKNVDGSTITLLPLTYNLYQGTASGSETKVASGLTSPTASVNTGLIAGSTYYWTFTSVDSGGHESSQSNEVCKTFPATQPNSMTITVTQAEDLLRFEIFNWAELSGVRDGAPHDGRKVPVAVFV